MKSKIIMGLLGALFAVSVPAFAAEMQPTAPAEQIQNAHAALISKVKNGIWLESYEDAIAVAKTLKRPVLIDFTGSDWCGWCIKLDQEVFREKAFQKYAEKDLVLLKIDFPRRKRLTEAQQKANMALAQKFGIRGFPTIVIVDSDGKELARTGYQFGGAKKYVKHLKELLKKQ